MAEVAYPFEDIEGAKISSDILNCLPSSGTWSDTMVIHVQIGTTITFERAQVLIH